jgi:hypothetical protein
VRYGSGRHVVGVGNVAKARDEQGGCEASLARMCTGEITLKTRMYHSEGELYGEARRIGPAGLAAHVALKQWHMALNLWVGRKDPGRPPCIGMAKGDVVGALRLRASNRLSKYILATLRSG